MLNIIRFIPCLNLFSYGKSQQYVTETSCDANKIQSLNILIIYLFIYIIIYVTDK